MYIYMHAYIYIHIQGIGSVLGRRKYFPPSDLARDLFLSGILRGFPRAALQLPSQRALTYWCPGTSLNKTPGALETLASLCSPGTPGDHHRRVRLERFMVGGSFLALVFVLFLVFQVDVSAKGFLILVNFQYGDCHSSQTPQTQEGCCTQSLASPSTGYHQTIQGETFEHFCNSPGASFSRSGFPSQAGHSNVGRYQDSVEMQTLQTVAQTERTVLSDLSSALAKCDRLVLCAWHEANHTGTRSTTAICGPMAASAGLVSMATVPGQPRTDAITQATFQECQRPQDSQEPREPGATNAATGDAHDAACTNHDGSKHADVPTDGICR